MNTKKVLLFGSSAIIVAGALLYFLGIYPPASMRNGQGAIGERNVYRAEQPADASVTPGSAPVAVSSEINDHKIPALQSGQVTKLQDGQLVQMNGQMYQLNGGQLVALMNGKMFNMNGQMVQLMNGQIVQMNGQLAHLMNGQVAQMNDGQLVQLMNGQMYQLNGGQMVHLMNGQMFQMNGQMVQLMNGQVQSQMKQ